jgi:hypothetical protein
VSRPPGIRCGRAGFDCTARFRHGTSLVLSAEPAPGGTLHSWDDRCRRIVAGECRIVIGEANELTVAFRRLVAVPDDSKLSITTSATRVTSASPGGNCGGECVASVPSGTEISLYTVGFWRDDCVGYMRKCRIVIDGPTHVSAVDPDRDTVPPPSGLNVTVSGPGEVSGGGVRCGGSTGRLRDCQQFVFNEVVTLRAKPARRLAGWGGFCRGRAPTCSVRVNAPKIVTARFRR